MNDLFGLISIIMQGFMVGSLWIIAGEITK